ncbi:hypothetical protein GQ457_11G024580 [Hibiscus cannabinus]
MGRSRKPGDWRGEVLGFLVEKLLKKAGQVLASLTLLDKTFSGLALKLQQVPRHCPQFPCNAITHVSLRLF